MTEALPGDVTRMLMDWSRGDRDALNKLIPVVYGELRRQAARYLRRERSGLSLQPTSLIHEAYLRLVNQRNAQWQNRAQFFGVAAQLMRRILVDHARTAHRAKRGGSAIPVALDDAMIVAAESPHVDVVALDEALARLELLDARQSRIVELRFFSGLTIEETAEVLAVSPATVKNDWSLAKAWLRREIGGSSGGR